MVRSARTEPARLKVLQQMQMTVFPMPKKLAKGAKGGALTNRSALSSRQSREDREKNRATKDEVKRVKLATIMEKVVDQSPTYFVPYEANDPRVIANLADLLIAPEHLSALMAERTVTTEPAGRHNQGLPPLPKVVIEMIKGTI